jgi:hypothetical protein
VCCILEGLQRKAAHNLCPNSVTKPCVFVRLWAPVWQVKTAPTYYFRKRVALGAIAGASLVGTVGMRCDDGAVLYINGIEVRVRSPAECWDRSMLQCLYSLGRATVWSDPKSPDYHVCTRTDTYVGLRAVDLCVGQIARRNMPSGAILHSTMASTGFQNVSMSNFVETFQIPAGVLISGGCLDSIGTQ